MVRLGTVAPRRKRLASLAPGQRQLVPPLDA